MGLESWPPCHWGLRVSWSRAHSVFGLPPEVPGLIRWMGFGFIVNHLLTCWDSLLSYAFLERGNLIIYFPYPFISMHRRPEKMRKKGTFYHIATGILENEEPYRIRNQELCELTSSI